MTKIEMTIGFSPDMATPGKISGDKKRSLLKPQILANFNHFDRIPR